MINGKNGAFRTNSLKIFRRSAKKKKNQLSKGAAAEKQQIYSAKTTFSLLEYPFFH